MVDKITVDFTELLQFSMDLDLLPTEVMKNVDSAVRFSSVTVKKAAAKSVGKRKYFRAAAAAIDFDVTIGKSGGQLSIESDIGYNKGKKPGRLGNLVEFGAPGSPNALTPGNELQVALAEVIPDFEKGLSLALGLAEKRAKL